MHCLRTVFSHLRQSSIKNNPVRRVFLVKQHVLRRSYTVSVTDDEIEKTVEEICNKDPDLEMKLRVLMLEVEVMRQDGRCAPDTLQTRHWKHLMDLPNRNQRIQYLTYLFKTEKSKENEKAKRLARKKAFEESPPEENKEFPDDLLYGISHQSLFLRIRDQSINYFDNYKALQAMIYGQPIVIDCSYDNYMVSKEILNAAKQLTFVFGDNRIHKNPFNIHLCNVNLDGPLLQQLKFSIPSITEPWFPMNISPKSYLDLFPKDKLVYLTPHCREELTRFDHDAVYIIGCMVDKVNNEQLSLAKAKRDGIKMAKLPLDRYLEWAPGSKKNLNINHMIPIMLDLKETGNWEHSLRHVPRRKLMETKIMAMQKKIKNPLLKAEVLRSYQNLPKMKELLKDNRRFKSKKSLHVDDERF